MLFYMMFFLYALWIMEALRRNGLSINSLISALNPFSALHRARWRNKLNANPLYMMDDPRDVMGVLLISLIKSTGEITTEQKQLVLRTLRKQFNFDAEEASHHFAHASFLMRDAVDIIADAQKIIKPLIGTCTPTQIISVETMLTQVSTEEGRTEPNAYQKALIAKVMQLIQEPQRKAL